MDINPKSRGNQHHNNKFKNKNIKYADFKKEKVEKVSSSEEDSDETDDTTSVDNNPMMIQLSKINTNLHLCNIEYMSQADNVVEIVDFEIVINISDSQIQKSSENQTIHDINLVDNKRIDYNKFHKIMEKIHNIIKQNISNKKIVVVCNNGVNRSVTAVIAYCIISQTMTFDNTLKYIEKIKKRKYPDAWESLTNEKFKSLLSALSQNYNYEDNSSLII